MEGGDGAWSPLHTANPIKGLHWFDTMDLCLDLTSSGYANTLNSKETQIRQALDLW